MAENKGYIVTKVDSGSIMISDDVIASVAATAVKEVEGIYGLSAGTTIDLSRVFRKNNLSKGIVVTTNDNTVAISCNLIVTMGAEVMVVAQKVQDAIISQVADVIGIQPTAVNVNVIGVAIPKEKN